VPEQTLLAQQGRPVMPQASQVKPLHTVPFAVHTLLAQQTWFNSPQAVPVAVPVPVPVAVPVPVPLPLAPVLVPGLVAVPLPLPVGMSAAIQHVPE
jgi:hypothetical protein